MKVERVRVRKGRGVEGWKLERVDEWRGRRAEVWKG
jgi:hypothetical protein